MQVFWSSAELCGSTAGAGRTDWESNRKDNLDVSWQWSMKIWKININLGYVWQHFIIVERTWQRDSHLLGHGIVRWEEILKYTPWKIFFYWQVDGCSDILVFYLYPVLLQSQETSSFNLDLLCHKATQNADWEVNHTDDKRDEKEEEQVQSLVLGRCSFQLLQVNFSPHREFIQMRSALSEGLPTWWALWCDTWRIWE